MVIEEIKENVILITTKSGGVFEIEENHMGDLRISVDGGNMVVRPSAHGIVTLEHEKWTPEL